MIDERKLSRWVPSLVIFIINVLFLAFVLGVSNNRLEVVENHAKDLDVHMPYYKKIEQFPTREEHNALVRHLERIDAKLDRLLEKD